MLWVVVPCGLVAAAALVDGETPTVAVWAAATAVAGGFALVGLAGGQAAQEFRAQIATR